MNKKVLITCIPAALILPGISRHIDITTYRILTPKVHESVRIALISDLHNAGYGKDMTVLVDAIRAQQPDLILLSGDLVGEHTEIQNACTLIERLKDIPMYYITGNHEARRPDMPELLKLLETMGVHLMDDQTVLAKVKDVKIEIGGLKSGLKTNEPPYSSDTVNQMFKTPHFRILMSHQPHWIQLYEQLDTDLVVSGHAHGGQWRIPFINQGIAAPNQGFFPKYVQGIHPVGHTHLIVSRGLTKHYHGIPRLYNNPELVLIELSEK